MTTMNNEDSVDPTVVAEPVAWAVMVRGRVQKLVVREDVADEVACKLREQDPRADAVPLYTADQMREAIAAERIEAERTMYLRGDALEFAEYLAKQAEYLLTALEYEDMARVAWDESGAGTPEFERWGNATDSRGEHAKKLRKRIYEFRKRVPRDPRYPCRSDGRCQYAIDHGAEGMGHCPAGKCAMPHGVSNGTL